jgi:hypothetical protein
MDQADGFAFAPDQYRMRSVSTGGYLSMSALGHKRTFRRVQPTRPSWSEFGTVIPSAFVMVLKLELDSRM